MRKFLLVAVLSAIIVVAGATQMIVTYTTYNSYYGNYAGVYQEDANAPVTGCTSPCLTVDTSGTSPTSTGSTSLGPSQTMYLWSPSFAAATSIESGNGAAMIYASSSSGYLTPSIDGTCTGTQNSGTSVSCSITTTGSSDTVIVFVTVGCSGSSSCTSPPTVSSVTATGLTFTKRAGITGSVSVASDNEEWAATASSALSGVTITATFSGTGTGSMVAAGITNTLSSSQFDGSASTASGTGTAASITKSTSYTNDIILGYVGYEVSGKKLGGNTPGSGFTSVASGSAVTSNKAGGSPLNTVSTGEYMTVTTTQTNLNVPFTDGTSANWFMIADAIEAAPVPSGSLSISFYTATSAGVTTLIGSSSSGNVPPAESLLVIPVSISASSIPAGGYLLVTVSSPSTGNYIIYWGASQLTSFQVTFSSPAF